MKQVKKIKDNISKSEFNHLINYVKADNSLRKNRKERLIKIFYILYYTGLRVNETSQLTNNKLIELLNLGQTKIIAHKQKIEKKIFVTQNGIKELKKIFNNLKANDDYIFVSERGSKNRPISINSVIRDVNSYLKKVFPHKNITSHSFRQTLITELANHNINTKIIQTIIGHKDISTTYRYIKPSESDILNSLNIVR